MLLHVGSLFIFAVLAVATGGTHLIGTLRDPK